MAPPSPKKNKFALPDVGGLKKKTGKSPSKSKAKAKPWSEEAVTRLIEYVEKNSVLWSVETKEYLTGKDKRKDL